MPSAIEIQARLQLHSLPGISALLPAGEFVMPHCEGLGLPTGRR